MPGDGEEVASLAWMAGVALWTLFGQRPIVPRWTPLFQRLPIGAVVQVPSIAVPIFLFTDLWVCYAGARRYCDQLSTGRCCIA